MARHKEFDETEALEAAMHSFWSRGYEGTSLHDLEISMNLTRTSIYNAFGNKREIFEKAITHYQETVLPILFGQLDHNVREGIKILLNNVIEFHFSKDNPGGCMVILAIFEREQHNVQTIELLEKPFKQLQKHLQKYLKEAQINGELGNNLDVNTLSTMIVTTITGIIVMGKAGFSKPALRKVVNAFCEQLFPEAQ